MSAPNFIAYGIVGGVLLVSLLAPLFIGADGWIVPVITLLFAVPYLLYDRKLAEKEARGEGAH
jgi:hypothetical protein